MTFIDRQKPPVNPTYEEGEAGLSSPSSNVENVEVSSMFSMSE